MSVCPSCRRTTRWRPVPKCPCARLTEERLGGGSPQDGRRPPGTERTDAAAPDEGGEAEVSGGGVQETGEGHREAGTAQHTGRREIRYVVYTLPVVYTLTVVYTLPLVYTLLVVYTLPVVIVVVNVDFMNSQFILYNVLIAIVNVNFINPYICVMC